MIHGAGNKGNLNLLYSLISKGIPYPFAAFENERSFLSIDNLNFIIHEIFSNSIASGVYNVADTEYVSTVEIIQMINDVLKKKGKVVKINKNIIKFVAMIGDKIKLPFNTEKLNKLTESYKVSNKKLIGAIGKKLPNSAKEGLLSTINSFTKE